MWTAQHRWRHCFVSLNRCIGEGGCHTPGLSGINEEEHRQKFTLHRRCHHRNHPRDGWNTHETGGSGYVHCVSDIISEAAGWTWTSQMLKPCCLHRLRTLQWCRCLILWTCVRQWPCVEKPRNCSGEPLLCICVCLMEASCITSWSEPFQNLGVKEGKLFVTYLCAMQQFKNDLSFSSVYTVSSALL